MTFAHLWFYSDLERIIMWAMHGPYLDLVLHKKTVMTYPLKDKCKPIKDYGGWQTKWDSLSGRNKWYVTCKAVLADSYKINLYQYFKLLNKWRKKKLLYFVDSFMCLFKKIYAGQCHLIMLQNMIVFSKVGMCEDGFILFSQDWKKHTSLT